MWFIEFHSPSSLCTLYALWFFMPKYSHKWKWFTDFCRQCDEKKQKELLKDRGGMHCGGYWSFCWFLWMVWGILNLSVFFGYWTPWHVKTLEKTKLYATLWKFAWPHLRFIKIWLHLKWFSPFWSVTNYDADKFFFINKKQISASKKSPEYPKILNPAQRHL